MVNPGERPGIFVSLHKGRDGGLRGCIGCLTSDSSLEDVVVDMTTKAATQDPRFRPIAPGEVPGIDIEISVLNPPEQIQRLEDIELGRDGLLVVGRGHRGVLLPQVATEYGWDAATFVEETCRKAGLPRDAATDDDVDVYRFSAEVFGELSEERSN